MNDSQKSTPPIPERSSRRPRGTIWIGGILAILMLVWGAVSLDLPFSPTDDGVGSIDAGDLSTSPDNGGQPEITRGSSRSDDATSAQAPPDQKNAESSPSAQTQFRPEQVVGHWLLDDSIRREIVIRPDGTATIHVRLDYLSSFLYGSEMTMQLKWSLKNNVLTHQFVSGEPKANVDRLINDFGGKRSYQVVDISEEALVLAPPGSENELHRWVAVKDEQGALSVSQ